MVEHEIKPRPIKTRIDGWEQRTFALLQEDGTSGSVWTGEQLDQMGLVMPGDQTRVKEVFIACDGERIMVDVRPVVVEGNGGREIKTVLIPKRAI